MKSDFITSCLNKIEASLRSDTFIDVETGKVELKDLSTGGNWRSLKETVCAYLNTDGGLIFCGIRERDKRYTVSGFDRKNEGNIIDLQNKCFKNDEQIFPDLSRFIYFEYHQLKGTDILVIVVYPLPDDLKFVSFDGKYYERKLTQDREIPAASLLRQQEYKRESAHHKELTILPQAHLNDLDLDKINHYVGLLNLEIRKETSKPSLEKAREFLSRQHFLQTEGITTLGMLICGKDPFYFLGARAEINCYYDTQSDIGKDKKIFRNDLLSLMEDAFRYVWGRINVRRSVQDGGKKEPEYPEALIREIINNALAHRDYSLSGFVTISVEPDQYIEIKNPGSFKEKMKLVHTQTEVPIRRLIPGIPESKNPRLASVLKVFDKIESQGRGMAALVNAALDNLTDLPYYELGHDTIRLRVPTGKLLDESMLAWLNGFEKYITGKLNGPPTQEHKTILAYFYKSEQLNRQRFFTILLTESNNHLGAIEALKTSGLIVEHPASTEITAVYVLDRVLCKTKFADEIIGLTGQEYLYYDPVEKEILDMTYLFSKYNQQALKASELTPEIYRRVYGRTLNPTQYESLGRKVRSACNRLTKKGILLKGERQAYSFNFSYPG